MRKAKKREKHNFLVSACLLGFPTRYNGSHKKDKKLIKELNKNGILFPFCPEQLSGLPTPRPACVFKEGRIVSINDLKDRTSFFRKGSLLSLKIAQILKPEKIFLKEKSPSCGVRFVYELKNGKKVLKRGEGLTAKLLREKGFKIEGRDP